MNPRSATMSRAPARGAPAGSAVANVGRRAGMAVLRLAARNPGKILGFVAVFGGAGVFGWNVLMTQTARHPAPLFGPAKPAVAPPVEPPRRPEAATMPPLPAPRPDPAALPGRPAAEPVSRTGSTSDPIGALIKSSDPQSPRASAETKPAPLPRVASAQKALAKLGYGPIGADGLIGSATRQALERFERDRSLPVTGALGPRTAKLLASASGIPVE
ncbi:peptidoglycan-binding domain-containing protein [uncultured Enterovirga sp.]|uniref:peptidoglycan-binding domain-containing protein n=1 Tax=uncultured Enterovirga sp. TaxID=2026352 RepID=UPI0035CB65D4